jgi:hypothetical protein
VIGTQPTDPASTQATVERTLRLSRMMRPEYVTTRLRTPDIETLGAERPSDLIVQSDISAVARIVSGGEVPAPPTRVGRND